MPKVLLVENDAVCRADIAETLREHGYDVDEARHGREALTHLEAGAEPPILILLDLATPIMNGWEFREAQLADPRFRSIPVALMTGNSDAADHARKLAALLLRKPFNLQDLLTLLSEAASAADSR